jgi:methylated-DNA-[protein]-cysteine S-methyltransferase
MTEHVWAATAIDTPIGPLSLEVSAAGLRAVRFGRVAELSGTPAMDALLGRARRQLEEYFAGARRRFDLVLDPIGTPFQRAAWAVLDTIEFGSTLTYGQQAQRLGRPSAARAVGAANGVNPLPIVVPCHRVMGASGALTGYAGGLDAKAWLLAHEAEVLAGRRF